MTDSNVDDVPSDELPDDEERIAAARAMTPAQRVRAAIDLSRAALRFAHGPRIPRDRQSGLRP